MDPLLPAATHPTASSPVRPSPAFVAVLAATALGAWLCVSEAIDGGIAVFVFVVAGWILSLILHEFAHAYTAWRGGDASIPSKGYLTLDPRRYAEPLTSIILPMVFVVMGGIGLPGGAVWINRGALRSPATASLVSLAGPCVNLVAAAVCLVPLAIGLVGDDTPFLAAGLSFLGFLQVAAFVLNMLPVPGLDGFGALEPYLPATVLRAVAPLRNVGVLLVILALFAYAPARNLFWDTVVSMVDLLARGTARVGDGWTLFRFWE